MTIQILEESHQVIYQWLNCIMDESDIGTQEEALTALRVVLHDLRDNLRLEMLAHLSAELPTLVRGLMFEGWRPSDDLLKQRTENAFIDAIRAKLEQMNYTSIVPEQVAIGVFRTIKKFVDAGQAAKIESILPRGLLAFWTK